MNRKLTDGQIIAAIDKASGRGRVCLLNEEAEPARPTDVASRFARALLAASPKAEPVSNDKRDEIEFGRGVIAALGILKAHGYPHGSVYHDSIVQSVGEEIVYAAAEYEDYAWAGLDISKRPLQPTPTKE